MDALLASLGGILLNALPTFVLIILLHFYLKATFFNPMEKVLAEREEATKGARQKAEAALQQANDKLRHYEQMIQAARNDIYKDQEQGRDKLKRDQDAQLAEAAAKAKEMIAGAQRQIAAEAATAQATLETEARSLAEKITGRILEGRAA